ncbi:autotransporter-associated beta strand repeat-containing protein [Simkania sp.]|uniref:autotransporter-associated beta strand repeat-containing protein n=1 Tax=Simkania sp. TaxID=34094 RepID=UPI003B5293BF
MRGPKKLVFSLFFSLSASLFGGSASWNVDQSGSWSLASNWSPVTVPNAATDTATFPNLITQPRTITVDGTFDVMSLNFASFNSYTLSSGTLNLHTGTIVANLPNGTHTINTNLALQSNATITNSTSNPLTISGVISGAFQLQSTAGNVILAGANTYSGGTNITGGTVQGTTTSIQGDVNGNGNLNFNQGSTTAPSYAGNVSGSVVIQVTGSGTVNFTGTNSGSSGDTQLNAGILQINVIDNLTMGNIDFNGGNLETLNSMNNDRSIVLTGNGIISPASGTTLTQTAGTISNAGGLIKAGSGIYDLGTTSNTYTGGTQINDGILQIGAASAIDGTGTITMNGGNLNSTGASVTLSNEFTINTTGIVGTDNNLELTGAISGPGTFIKAGSGTVNFNMAASTNGYSGGTEINSGTLQISENGNFGTGTITFNSGTLKVSTPMDELIPNTVVIGGTNGTFDVDGALVLTLQGAVSGSGILIKEGTGILNMGPNANSYSGGTQLNTGTIQLVASGNLGTGPIDFGGGTLELPSGNVTLENDGTMSSTALINVGAGATLTMNGDFSGAGGLTMNPGTGTLILGGTNSYLGTTTITMGTVQGTTNSLQGTIVNNSLLIFAQDFDGTFSGTISGAGGTVRKVGAGTVTLTGINSYGVGTEINGGAFRISADNQIGAAATPITFNNGTLETSADINPFSHPITLTAGSQGFISPDAGTTLTQGATISGGGTLVKIGEGTYDLDTTNNTFTGGTIIREGILEIDQAANLNGTGQITLDGGTLHSTATFTQTNAVAVNASSTILTTGGTTLTLSGPLTGNRRLIKDDFGAGIGTLALENFGGFTGDIRIDAGIVSFNGNGTYSGDISGAGTVNVDNAASVTLLGDNSYTGGTNVLSGMLTGNTRSLQGAIAISAGANLTFNQNFNGFFNGTLTVAGTMTKTGSGITFFVGNFAGFTGTTTIDGGRLNLTGSFGGDVVVNSGGTFSGDASVVSLTNSGTVSVGNGIGVMTVNGTYTQNPSGNLEIEVDSLGNNDVLNVVGGGSADLGGNLDVTLLPGVYDGTSVYTIINAATVNNNFDSTSSSVGVPVNVVYNLTNVQINVPYAGSVTPVPINDLPPNAKNIANYLFCPGFVPENPDLFNVMQTLLTLHPKKFVSSLTQLGPSIFGALPFTDLQNNHLIADTIVSNSENYFWCDDCVHLTKCPESFKETYVWLAPVGQWQRQRGYEEQIEFITRTYGFGAGAYHLFLPWLQFGGGVGYTYTNLGWKKNGGDAHWHSVYVGPSVGLVNQNWYFNFLTQGNFNFYSVERKIRIPGISLDAHNDHYSFGLLMRADAGYKLTFVTQENDYPMSFIPTVRLSYMNVFEESYKETGAKSINLDVSSKYTAFLQPELLIKVLREVYFSDSCLSSSFHLGYVANIPVSSATYTSKFVGDEDFCESNFTVQTFDRTAHQCAFGFEFIYKKANLYEAGVSCEGRAFDKLYITSAKIHVDWKF